MVLGGSTGLVTLGLDSEQRAARFVRALRVIRPLLTIGGLDSLAATTDDGSHASLDPGERRAAGIPRGTVRLSLGIEDVDDLLLDLEGALAATTPRRAAKVR